MTKISAEAMQRALSNTDKNGVVDMNGYFIRTDPRQNEIARALRIQESIDRYRKAK
jgi:hypothetical protein